GDTPIVHKVLNAQRAGALGVVVADDGRCGDKFGQLCVHGSTPPPEGGWAELDLPLPWEEVRVPVVLMLARAAEEVRGSIKEAGEAVKTLQWTSLHDLFPTSA
ncbi:unnamed protein product, partial [Discosporangium mesarthrocarpum]